MPRAPQEIRTYFITTVCASRRRLFQISGNGELMLRVLQTNRAKSRMCLHGFVLMPDHMHLLLTPAPDVSLEKVMQFLKGGFSFLLKSKLDVWQRSYTERRITDSESFAAALQYIERNPVRSGLVAVACEFAFSSAGRPEDIDLRPLWLQ